MTAERAASFCQRFQLRCPLLMAPMAGACPPGLAAAVARAGGMGACGALLMQPAEMLAWAHSFREQTDGPLQINLWIPDPPPARDPHHEAQLRSFLSDWGPPVPQSAADAPPPPFEAQCEALLEIAPAVVSSIMGLYSASFVEQLKARGIAWFATVTTVREARAAEAAGADGLIAQGMEAGGHRGTFDAGRADRELVGLFALLPAVVDAVALPVVATGGIADGRGVAAALTLGASAVQIGTALLRCPEAQTHPAWADAIARTAPEATVLTRAFSGRWGRSIETAYVRAAATPAAPAPAPYPVQRGLTAPLRKAAVASGDLERMQVWAGQSATLARAEPAGAAIERIWRDAQQLLR